MTGKSKEGYKMVLSSVIDWGIEKLDKRMCPKSVMVDFEWASILSFEYCFPTVEMRGCYFHFAQCL